MTRSRAWCALSVLLVVLAACAPQVTFLPLKTARPTQAPLTPTATLTPTSTPIPGAALGVSAEALRGVEITFWHGADGSQAALLAQLAAEFSLGNPWGIAVKTTGWGNAFSLNEAFRSEKNSPPALLLALPEQAAAWDEENLLAPLQPYLLNPEFGLTEQELADFAPALDAADTRLLPTVRSARLLAYNQTWARELGFETAPQTPAQFRQQACAANAFWKSDPDLSNDGYGGWALDGNPWTAYGWLRAFGGDLWDGKAFVFETPAAQQAFEFVSDLRAAGCAWVSADEVTYASLPARQALFASLNLGEISEQAAAFEGSSDEWTLVAFPGQAGVSYGAGLALPKSTPARQLAAWLFARWLAAPEVQARWAAQTGYLPGRLSALTQMTAYAAAHPHWAAAAALMGELGAPPAAARWGLARGLLGDGLSNMITLGLAPQEMLAQAQTMFNDLTK